MKTGNVDNKRTPKINLNIYDEEISKYEGKPLIEPKIPYQFKVKTFKVDQNWTRMQKIQQRALFISESFKEYILDIAFARTDPFVFKTAEFTKRNFNTIKHTLLHILYELRKIKTGFKKLWGDIMFKFGFWESMYTNKYTKVDVMARQKVRQVQTDVIKFVPFSIFIIIPGLELLLPAFLLVFPNSIPSQFLSDEAREKKFR